MEDVYLIENPYVRSNEELILVQALGNQRQVIFLANALKLAKEERSKLVKQLNRFWRLVSVDLGLVGVFLRVKLDPIERKGPAFDDRDDRH